MSLIRCTLPLTMMLGLALSSIGSAQDDASLDALLQDLTLPATSAPAPEVTAEVLAEPVAEAEVMPVEALEELVPAPEAPAPELTPVAEEAAPEVIEAAPELLVQESVPVEAAPEPVVVEELLPMVEEPVADATMVTEPEPVPVVETMVMEEVSEIETAPEVVSEVAVEAEPIAQSVEADAAASVSEMPEGMDPALFAQQEEARRQMREKEGIKSLADGMAALEAGKMDEAIMRLQEAQAKIPARSSNAARLEQARSSLGMAHMRKAQEAFEKNDLKTARASLNQAKSFVPAGALEDLDRKVSRGEAKAAVEAAKPIPVKDLPEMVEREKTIDELLSEGRQYLELGDFNAAEVRFEKVLIRDEYNITAMRFLRKLDNQRYKARSKEREATEADMIQRVRDTWNPPVREDTPLPQSVQNRGAVETKTSAQKLQEKMEQIIIPSIEFRQANITDVVNFLVEASISGDKIDGTGVNIILNLSMPGGDSATPAPAASAPADGGFGGDFGGGFDDLGAAPAAPLNASSPGIPTITLNLRRISLLDAVKYITEVARLKFRLEENAVMITPEGVVSGRVITRLYPVQPSIIDVVVDREAAPERTGEFVEMGSSRSSIKKSDVKDFFEKTGVPFPAGTSITYNPAISQLIVANTPENLEVFERILSRLNVIPNQVEIEARFVEISQDDLEELGFQWILTDNWEIAQKQGIGGVAGQEMVIANADANGFTKGLRFFNQSQSSGAIQPLASPLVGSGNTPLGGILSFASVLTNPEVKVVLQALSQHGGTDLLSAPRVTTRSGVNAQIQVVREIIYPTEFEVSEPTISASTVSTGTGTAGGLVTPPTVTPGSFETRETGVILNVTPTVGPDGYTIDLTMVPEVAELVDWIQYGSSASAGGVSFTYNIPQPVFASRNVTTSIVIWDGQTVVMGGLIREDLVKVKDKVPLLGDIPLIGRLFRSEGEYSKKKNLLIFVTARLVDPSGKPIHRGEAVGAAENSATPDVPVKP
jgi:general secretion pathway protein D